MTSRVHIGKFEIEESLSPEPSTNEPVKVTMLLTLEGEFQTTGDVVQAIIVALQDLHREKYRPDLTGMEPGIGGKNDNH